MLCRVAQDDDEEIRGLTSAAVGCLELHIPVESLGEGRLYLGSHSDSDFPIPKHMPLVQVRRNLSLPQLSPISHPEPPPPPSFPSPLP